MSCGCLGRETNSKRMFIHGFAVKKEQFYNIFSSMKQRCDNPNQKKYPIYGGRGIKYEWKSFQEFHNDMYKSYKLHVNKYGKRNTSIDRINNNGNYNKENCRWATYKEQARNKQNNTLITFNNKTHCVAEWCEIFNIKSSTFLTRIIRQKWTIEKAFTQPVRKRK